MRRGLAAAVKAGCGTWVRAPRLEMRAQTSVQKRPKVAIIEPRTEQTAEHDAVRELGKRKRRRKTKRMGRAHRRTSDCKHQSARDNYGREGEHGGCGAE